MSAALPCQPPPASVEDDRHRRLLELITGLVGSAEADENGLATYAWPAEEQLPRPAGQA
jgi:hypothetical protein